MTKRGVSVFEIVALIILIVSAYVGDALGSRYSYTMGIVGMIVFPFAAIFIVESLAWLERELFIGQKPLPLCSCGKKTIDKMPVENVDGILLSKCNCGRKYDTSLRGKIKMIDRGGESEFAVWKPFKGWLVN